MATYRDSTTVMGWMSCSAPRAVKRTDYWGTVEVN